MVYHDNLGLSLNLGIGDKDLSIFLLIAGIIFLINPDPSFVRDANLTIGIDDIGDMASRSRPVNQGETPLLDDCSAHLAVAQKLDNEKACFILKFVKNKFFGHDFIFGNIFKFFNPLNARDHPMQIDGGVKRFQSFLVICLSIKFENFYHQFWNIFDI
jgi:hypothetical protein